MTSGEDPCGSSSVFYSTPDGIRIWTCYRLWAAKTELGHTVQRKSVAPKEEPQGSSPEVKINILLFLFLLLFIFVFYRPLHLNDRVRRQLGASSSLPQAAELIQAATSKQASAARRPQQQQQSSKQQPALYTSFSS